MSQVHLDKKYEGTIVVFVVYSTSFNQLHLQRTLYIHNRRTIPRIWYRVHKTQLNRLQCTLFLEGVALVQNPKSPFNPTRHIHDMGCISKVLRYLVVPHKNGLELIGSL